MKKTHTYREYALDQVRKALAFTRTTRGYWHIAEIMAQASRAVEEGRLDISDMEVNPGLEFVAVTEWLRRLGYDLADKDLAKKIQRAAKAR